MTIDNKSEESGCLLFILGRGRSGTTLLSRILNQHTGIVVPYEGLFIKNLSKRYRIFSGSARQRKAFIKDFFAERRMRTWGISAKDLDEALSELGTETDFETVCRSIFKTYLEAQGSGKQHVVWMGDKNPLYGLFAADLAASFPTARFVYVYRDPRDNICSYRNVPFDSSDVGALAERWTQFNTSIMGAEAKFPSRFTRISYEELVSHPEPALVKICEFLGLPFEKELLLFHEEKNADHFWVRHEWHSALEKPLTDSRMGRWRDELSEKELSLVRGCCGDTADKLGYNLEGVSGAPPWMLVLKAKLSGRARCFLERFLFECLPLGLRTCWINFYRGLSGRE